MTFRHPSTHLRPRTVITGPSATRQEHKNECQISTIIDKYRRTGQLTHVREHLGSYLDVSELPDFTRMMDIRAKAAEQFELLPAHIRESLGNDPAVYVDFMATATDDEFRAVMGIDRPDTPPDSPPAAPPVAQPDTPPAAPSADTPTE